MKNSFFSYFRNCILPSIQVGAGGLSFLLLLFSSCENETYDAGDGKYSYVTAEFGEVSTGASTKVIGVVTDENRVITFSQPYTAQWATTPDSVYRALVYYNNVENERITAHSISRIPVTRPYVTTRPDTLAFDPIVFESAWVSKNKKYLNVGLYVKTGQADGIDGTQIVGVMRDGTETLADGTHQLKLRMYHDQRGVPEYYSAHAFISIPLKDVNAERIVLTIPTYDGWKSSAISLTE